MDTTVVNGVQQPVQVTQEATNTMNVLQQQQLAQILFEQAQQQAQLAQQAQAAQHQQQAQQAQHQQVAQQTKPVQQQVQPTTVLGISNDATAANNTTLGAKLRALSASYNDRKLVDEFIEVLMKAAREKGVRKVDFVDLRQFLNSKILDGSIWSWLDSEDLKYTGQVDPSTGNYKYTIYW